MKVEQGHVHIYIELQLAERASIQIICPYPLQDANNIVVNLVDSMDAKIQTILFSALLTVWTPRYQPCSGFYHNL